MERGKEDEEEKFKNGCCAAAFYSLICAFFKS